MCMVGRYIIGTDMYIVYNQEYNYTLGIVYIFITTYLSTCIVMKQQAVHLVNYESACIIIYNY